MGGRESREEGEMGRTTTEGRINSAAVWSTDRSREQEKGRKALEREMRERALKAGDQPVDTKRPSERSDFRGFAE